MTSLGSRMPVAPAPVAEERQSLHIVPFAGESPAWDAFVRADANAGFAHLAAWGPVIADVFGHTSLAHVARDDRGEIAGVLPLVRIRNRLLGDHLVSVPFLNDGGPVGSPAARTALHAHAVALAERLRADTLALRPRVPLPGADAPSARKITVVLDLPEDEDTLWMERFTSKFRNKIKRPQREGMTTAFGPEHLGAFYEVFAANMREHGTPVLPRAFFERIVATFPDLPLIGATYFKGRAVAAGFGFVWRDQFEMTWSASLRELGALKPTMLLYWDYMRELIARDVRRFDFGRSTPGSGQHEFKLSWGARDEALPWIDWPERPDAGGRDGRAMRIATRVWQHLPLSTTKRVGPALARLLPWW